MDKLANTVINKITHEAEQLAAANGDVRKVHAVMKNIHLLSEVWLESYGEEVPKKETSSTNTVIQPSDLTENNSRDVNVSDEGMSIFDF